MELLYSLEVLLLMQWIKSIIMTFCEQYNEYDLLIFMYFTEFKK